MKYLNLLNKYEKLMLEVKGEVDMDLINESKQEDIDSISYLEKSEFEKRNEMINDKYKRVIENEMDESRAVQFENIKYDFENELISTASILDSDARIILNKVIDDVYNREDFQYVSFVRRVLEGFGDLESFVLDLDLERECLKSQNERRF